MNIVLTILSVAVTLYLLAGFLLAWQTLHLKRQPIIRTPKDYNMNYKDISFSTPDDLVLKGWFIPNSASNRLLLFAHVGSFNRHGLIPENQGLFKLYDEEVEMLKTAKNFHKAGYNIIMFDLRNHGESSTSPNGGALTVGISESLDIIGLMNFIKDEEKLRDMDIYIMAFCTGANSVIIAMSKEKGLFRKVKSMAAIQPVTMDVFIRSYLRRMLTPIGPLILMPIIRFWVKLLTNHKTTDMSPMEYVKDIPCPTLFIQARNDPWTEAEDYNAIYKNAAHPKKQVLLEEPVHRFDTYKYFEDKPDLILEWFEKERSKNSH